MSKMLLSYLINRLMGKSNRAVLILIPCLLCIYISHELFLIVCEWNITIVSIVSTVNVFDQCAMCWWKKNNS